MKIYRIYTERKNLKWMCTMISEYFGGFTIYRTAGYWNAKAEKSVVIEIITDDIMARHKIRQIAMKIKGYNDQDAVIKTETGIDVEVL